MQLDVPSALSRRSLPLAGNRGPGSTFAVGTGFRPCSGFDMSDGAALPDESCESLGALAVFAVFCSENRAIGFAPPRKSWVGAPRRGAVTAAIPLSVCCLPLYREC